MAQPSFRQQLHNVNLRWGAFTEPLDPDADEVLLELLSRDAEPPSRHELPHRRWIAPPTYHHYNDDGFFRQLAPGHWVVEPPGTPYAPPVKRTKSKEQLRKENLVREWQSRYEAKIVQQPEPIFSLERIFEDNYRAAICVCFAAQEFREPSIAACFGLKEIYSSIVRTCVHDWLFSKLTDDLIEQRIAVWYAVESYILNRPDRQSEIERILILIRARCRV
jgi:hypothetical protein